MRKLIIRKLLVDDRNELFDLQGMRLAEFPSDYSRIREYAAAVLDSCPEAFREDGLLEQQLSEIIKNGIKHGNGCDPDKKIRIWHDLRRRARFIVEDEGPGFLDLEEWNLFFKRRQEALFNDDFDGFLALASYRGPKSGPEDGGNSLFAALEYWNGGMIYNAKRNKVGVVRWFQDGSAEGARAEKRS